MNLDLERGTVGERDVGDNVTYGGDGGCGRLVGATKNMILEIW
jgi:hypothetical protein